MAFSLVGSVGAVTQGASGASVTPAWGTGESRTAGNLLVLWVSGHGTSTNPATPTGWTIALESGGGTTISTSVFFKIAAGGDAAPTVAGIASTVLSAQLAEFSGNDQAAPLDQVGSNAATTSPILVPNPVGFSDALAGELVVTCSCALYSTAATKTLTDSLNNGATANSTNNNATSTVNHYTFAWGITTGNSTGDQNSFSFTASKITQAGGVYASFKLAAAAVAKLTTSGTRRLPLRRTPPQLFRAPVTVAAAGVVGIITTGVVRRLPLRRVAPQSLRPPVGVLPSVGIITTGAVRRLPLRRTSPQIVRPPAGVGVPPLIGSAIWSEGA